MREKIGKINYLVCIGELSPKEGIDQTLALFSEEIGKLWLPEEEIRDAEANAAMKCYAVKSAAETRNIKKEAIANAQLNKILAMLQKEAR